MKTILAIILNLGLVTASFAVNGTPEILADETALAYSTNFDYEANDVNTGRLSAQVTYTSATIAAATFTNGRVSTGTIIILSTTSLNGTVLRIHTKDFSFGRVADYPNATLVAVGASTAASANNLLTKIKADTTLSPLIGGVSTYAQIDLTSVKSDGVKYVLTTNKPTVVSVSSHTTLDGVAATVSTNDSITIAGTAFTTGLKVALTGSNLPGALTATDYYVLRVDANTIKLSSTSALAQAGTAIDITSVNVGTTAYTYTLTPAAISGTPSFKWQASNDGLGWADLNTSSVTMSAYTAGGLTSIWDLTNFNHRWLRLNVTGPTTGGIYLKAILNRKD
jgi:hypothetical protein